MRRYLFIATLLLAFLLSANTASAMYAKKIARQVVALQNEGFRSVKVRPIADSTRDDLLTEKACFREIYNAPINKDPIEEEMSYQFGFYWTIDKYFFLSHDASVLLKGKAIAFRKKGKRLAKMASGANGRRIARSIIDHAIFADYYLNYRLEDVDTDFCLMKARILELGGYNNTNAKQAFNEIILSNETLQTALRRRELFTYQQRATRILRVASEMAHLGVGKKQRRLYRKQLTDALLTVG